MEDLLQYEQAAHKHVLDLIKSRTATHEELVQGLNQYRPICRDAILASFPDTTDLEDRQWALHTEARRYFYVALRQLRKAQPALVVETRKLAKEYLRFLKDSESSYREYIYHVSVACNGIPQLDNIAHAFKGEGAGESQQQNLPEEYYKQAVLTCHRTLVYLGDLSRYRASDALDQEPKWGPAIGYYDLADATLPNSGSGHHQQAVIARERDNHLLSIYHLYRSLAVEVPHQLAAANLKLAFAKIDAAWKKGELIQKGPPNDPDAHQRFMVGFFVYMHSMCFKGVAFAAQQELEREIFNHLVKTIDQRSHGHTVMRMAVTNMAAQYLAIQNITKFNLKTFVALLRVSYEDLHAKVEELGHADVELSAKLTPIFRYLLPILRVYHDWLCGRDTLKILLGLGDDDRVGGLIRDFWTAYARTIDLIAQAFPVWDLDDVPELTYMLEEDVSTVSFLPVQGERTNRTWYTKQDGVFKPRFSDRGVIHLSSDEEMLCRVRRMLDDGTDLAISLAPQGDDAPVKLLQTRFYTGEQRNIEDLVVRPIEYKPEPIALPKSKKPVSYAAAAAAGKAIPQQPRVASGPPPTSTKAPSRDAQVVQLSRMVDDLVDDDEGNNPVTPPQQPASNPAIVSNGDVPHVLQDSVHDFISPKPQAKQAKTPAAANNRVNGNRSPYNSRPGTGYDRMHGVAKIWDNVQRSPYSSFPSGLPTGTLGSPAAITARGHSRVNSANSVRSRGSHHAADPWTAADVAAPRTMPGDTNSYEPQSSLDQIGMTSPLLFGAGRGLWSTGLQAGYRNVSPPHGQGG